MLQYHHTFAHAFASHLKTRCKSRSMVKFKEVPVLLKNNGPDLGSDSDGSDGEDLARKEGRG